MCVSVLCGIFDTYYNENTGFRFVDHWKYRHHKMSTSVWTLGTTHQDNLWFFYIWDNAKLVNKIIQHRSIDATTSTYISKTSGSFIVFTSHCSFHIVPWWSIEAFDGHRVNSQHCKKICQCNAFCHHLLNRIFFVHDFSLLKNAHWNTEYLVKCTEIGKKT